MSAKKTSRGFRRTRESSTSPTQLARLLEPSKVKHVLDFHDIPIGADLFLISETQAGLCSREWELYLSGHADPQRHPHHSLRTRFCAALSKNRESLELSLEVNIVDRWHDAKRVLPRSDFKGCVQWWNFQKQPYLVVSRRWMRELGEPRFSIYALVDVIGTKKQYATKGRIDAEALGRFRASIDAIARSKRSFAFLSFADNVLVRSDWNAAKRGAQSTYEPEAMLAVVSAVRAAIKSDLHSESYAIFSQGTNWAANDAGKRAPRQPNHAVFGGLGAPFAELFRIEQAVKSSMRSKRHEASDYYLARSFAQSLRYKGSAMPEEIRGQIVSVPLDPDANENVEYLPIEHSALIRSLRLR